MLDRFSSDDTHACRKYPAQANLDFLILTRGRAVVTN